MKFDNIKNDDILGIYYTRYISLKEQLYQSNSTKQHIQELYKYISENYESAILEKKLLSQKKAILDSKLQIILEQISKTPEITITYFIKDQRKNGGSYSTKTGLVKKIDNDKQEICFVDNSKILINDIIDITGEIFKMFE